MGDENAPEHSPTDAERERLAAWKAHERLLWTAPDYLAAALAAATGVLACLFDADVDAAVERRLGWLKKTDLLRRWERDSSGLPIDYIG